MIFQMMFAIIISALILGAFAERMQFSAFLVFSHTFGKLLSICALSATGFGVLADGCVI